MMRVLPAGPYLVAAPGTSLVVALGAKGLGLGVAGVIGGAASGLVWGILIGVVAERVHRGRRFGTRLLANGTLFLGILASGVMLGGGAMYALLMTAAAAAPPGVLSAMMQPTIPFFMILNTPLELLIIPGALFSNWRNDTRRRLVLMAAAAYYVLRIWTYPFYVPNRMAIASRPLLADDLAWFYESLRVDYRPILVAVVLVAFTAAAFVPERPRAH